MNLLVVMFNNVYSLISQAYSKMYIKYHIMIVREYKILNKYADHELDFQDIFNRFFLKIFQGSNP
jgi:hypothetical protein